MLSITEIESEYLEALWNVFIFAPIQYVWHYFQNKSKINNSKTKTKTKTNAWNTVRAAWGCPVVWEDKI